MGRRGGEAGEEYPLVLTENEFLAVLNRGVYTYNLLGHQVVLNNSAATSGTNPNYMIVDLDHDSANTGQTNCYDLMAVDCVSLQPWSTSIQPWTNSSLRTWLNNTYYSGFSNSFKSHIQYIKYYDPSSTLITSDKVTIPSIPELLGPGLNGVTTNQGTQYPLLPNWVKRYQDNPRKFWSRSPGTSDNVWINSIGGGIAGVPDYNEDARCTFSNGIAPLIRVS